MGVYMSWVVAGLIMLAITIFIHKHTFTVVYSYKSSTTYRKAPFPMWMLLFIIIISIVPIVNIIAFLIGVISYCMGLAEEDIIFRCELKWYTKIVKFLTKEV